jgi:hypothetical protein
MPAKPLPPYDLLHECLTYDPATGVFLWKVRPDGHFGSPNGAAWWNAQFAYKAAGSLRRAKKGVYRMLEIFAKAYPAHRVAWKMMTGRDPRATIDHRDGNTLANHWTNIREATNSEQAWNKPHSNKTSGRRGVYRGSKNRWRAQIKINQKNEHLGSFLTIEEAVAAYEARAREIAGDFYYNE